MRNMYSGNRIPASIMQQFEVEIREDGAGVLAPYWLAVLERGRGKRKSNKDSGLALKMFGWMAKRNMFRSKTPAGQMAEARALTWYINKYGNKHFRSGTFVDIYTSAREQLTETVGRKYFLASEQITKTIL